MIDKKIVQVESFSSRMQIFSDWEFGQVSHTQLTQLTFRELESGL